MNETAMAAVDESRLVELLGDLSAVQDELLEVLMLKRRHMAKNDVKGMQELHQREEALLARLSTCHERRSAMLEEARQQGLSADSIGTLAAALPEPQRDKIGNRVKQVSSRMRLLQHHSLTNWVVAQQTLLHLSQLLEIIATGGQLKPTYSKGPSPASQGALVDRAA